MPNCSYPHPVFSFHSKTTTFVNLRMKTTVVSALVISNIVVAAIPTPESLTTSTEPQSLARILKLIPVEADTSPKSGFLEPAWVLPKATQYVKCGGVMELSIDVSSSHDRVLPIISEGYEL